MAGFQPVLGVDLWSPAVSTYHANIKAPARKQNVLELSRDISLIENLPEAEIIIGSPPCVSFSNSNKSGYADKSLGIQLTEAFFRIVAVRKHSAKSSLIGWMMENVPKATHHLSPYYSFADLRLSDWAVEQGLNPGDLAIDLQNRMQILDSSKFGAPQRRRRLFIMEVSDKPVRLDEIQAETGPTLGEILSQIPKPALKSRRGKITDPNYEDLTIYKRELTDHYYDTGIEFRYWKESQFLKTNHPYMGKMSFPEKMSSPARTVVASPFPRSRETMIFKCESKRIGDGEYRLPTVREAAVLMSFPLTYQFIGNEGAKWRLIGNAVCPATSYKIGLQIRKLLGRRRTNRKFTLPCLSDEFVNLNSQERKSFNSVTKRRTGARFRRHAFKSGNMTVTLANYDLVNKESFKELRWEVYVTYGISTGHIIDHLKRDSAHILRGLIEKKLGKIGEELLNLLDRNIAIAVPLSAKLLQEKYEDGMDYVDSSNPVSIVEDVREHISQIINGELVDVSGVSDIRKPNIPLRQAVSAYALLRAVSILDQGIKT